MEPLRIVHVMGSLEAGGIQSFVMNVYRVIDRNYYQFDFVVEHHQNRFYESEIRELGGRVFYHESFNGRNVVSYRRQWRNLLSNHPEWGVMHCHLRSSASLFLPIAKKSGIKVIVHSHSTSEPSSHAVIKRVLEYPLRFQADACLSCSSDAGVWLFGRRIANSNRFKVINNCLEVNRYKYSPTERDRLRKDLGIDDKTFVYGTVGRLVQVKRQAFLIKAFKVIKASKPASVLLIIGDGPLRGDLEALAMHEGVGDAVYFLGERSDVCSLCSAMDAFVLPSEHEGLGISLVEAQISGLPCVYSDTIPKEAVITSRGMRAKSVRDGIGSWANECIAITTATDRSIPLKAYEYDASTVTMQLLNTYNELLLSP